MLSKLSLGVEQFPEKFDRKFGTTGYKPLCICSNYGVCQRFQASTLLGLHCVSITILFKYCPDQAIYRCFFVELAVFCHIYPYTLQRAKYATRQPAMNAIEQNREAKWL